MFYVNLNEIESIEYRKALNVYHYIITHNEDFRTLHKVVEPNTLIKPEVIDFSRITKFGYRLVKLSNGYYTYAYYALGLSYEYEHNNQKAIENYKKYVKLEHDQGLINAVNNKIKQLQK